MDFNGSGGLLILGFVAVWLIVFTPSMGKKKQSQNDPLTQRQERLAAIRESSSPELSKQARTAKNRSRTLMFVSALASIASIVGLFSGSAIIALAGAGVAAVLIIASRIVTIRFNAASRESSKRINKVSAGLVGKPIADIDEIGEQPGLRVSQVPAPLYRQVATLEEVTLADVVKLEHPQELERETLDEILRRRRAN